MTDIRQRLLQDEESISYDSLSSYTELLKTIILVDFLIDHHGKYLSWIFVSWTYNESINAVWCRQFACRTETWRRRIKYYAWIVISIVSVIKIMIKYELYTLRFMSLLLHFSYGRLTSYWSRKSFSTWHLQIDISLNLFGLSHIDTRWRRNIERTQ